MLLRGGPLVPEYRAVVPTGVVPGGLRRAEELVGWSAGPATWASLRECRRARTVLANTLVTLPVAVGAVGASTRLVCWVHELDGVANRVLAPGRRRDAAVERVDLFLAAGPAVVEMLVSRWHVPAHRVVEAPPFVDDSEAARRAHRDGHTPWDRGEGPPLLLAVGGPGDRKGTDRFMDLLAGWPDHPVAPRGRWLGGVPDSPPWDEAQVDVVAAGLSGRVEIVPTVPDVGAALRSADVVVSVAREDPYPLTVLEAGLWGRPVAGTDSGGIAAVLDDAGLRDMVTAPGDVLALQRVVAGLLGDAAARARAGHRLGDHVRATHLTERLSPVVWSALELAQ